MTLTNPPFVLQGSSHGAQLFREALGSLLVPAGGIVQAGDFALSQNGSPNMSVNVAAGRCWIPGTSLATVNPGGGAYYPQGSYYAENDATVNLGVSASDPAKPRIDTVIAQVQDAAYVGVTNSAAPAVVTGTPTTGATLGNLTGKGAVPVSSLVLGYVLVPANATTIVTADLSSTALLALSGLGNVLRAPAAVASSSTLVTGAVALAAPSTTQTLPVAQAGAVLEVMADASVGGATSVTVLASGSAKIFGGGVSAAGVTSILLGTPLSSVVLASDGTNWYIIDGQQDTGWIALTLGTNITTQDVSFGGWAAAARLVGNMVFLRGTLFNNTGAPVAHGTTLATIPSSCRPIGATNTVYLPATSFNTASAASAISLSLATVTGLLANWASWPTGSMLPLDGLTYSILAN